MWTAKLQTVIGASSILRTLMKDARRGLHSLVETQGCLRSPEDHLEVEAQRQGGKLPISSSSLARGTSGRTSTGLPNSSTPCTAMAFFARSIPTVTIAPISPFRRTSELMKRSASPSWHCVADNRNPYGSRLAWDGEVPFVR
jgi:hypothetical protein